ncbi:hypothetical protein BU14_0482s0012 [Porphyra umbilicalis]|uniref:FAD-binding FR-type domain-containing protein n=1 Tax=Porphyra umbilicalis TaxID=2786 RepID=A0A1X6NTT5_PORUM|nr:hypothetical protein BU14_0482s0012 [Porphyra umbilicalis]|eukprot:OSX72018.1 hypothetical protein BU14_0482s0012 [Porphyra umbilicalis]
MPAAHMAVGVVIVVAAILHAIFHLIAGLTPGDKAIGWAPGWGGWTHAAVTGFALIGVLGVMAAASVPAVRRRRFELFYGVHLVGAALFFGLFIFHTMLGGVLYSWKWVAAPLTIYAADRVLRRLSTRRGRVTLSPTSAAMTLASPDVLRIALPRLFDYRPGQYAELRIPALSGSPLGWHPFTIASAPHEGTMVFFIKASGDWTAALHALVADAKRGGAAGDGTERGIEVAAAEAVIRQTRGPRPPPAAAAPGGGEGAVGDAPAWGGVPASISKVGQSFLAPIAGAAGAAPAAPPADVAVPIVADEAVAGAPLTDEAGRRYSASTVVSFGRSSVDTAAAPREPSPDEYGLFASDRVSLAAACRSVTASVGVLWLLLARIGVFAIAAAVHAAAMGPTPRLSQYAATGLIVADVVLAAAAAVPAVLVTAAEVASRTCWRSAAASAAPAAALVVGVALPAAALGGVANPGIPVGYLQALVLLPLTVGLYLWRHCRLLGERLAVAPSRSAAGTRLRSVDFVWTAPTAMDDAWVVGELAPLVDAGGYVRLHRFGTREAPPPPPSTAPPSSASAAGATDGEGGDVEAAARWDAAARPSGRMSLNYGRPDWAPLLDRTVAHSRSGSVVGLFFCGSPVMEAAVRAAAVAAMTESRRRGMAARLRTVGGGGRRAKWGGGEVCLWPQRAGGRAVRKLLEGGGGGGGDDRVARHPWGGHVLYNKKLAWRAYKYEAGER